MINQFKDEFLFLSNFYSSPIIWGDREWPTVEHAFQAMKSLDFEEQEKIRKASTPGIAKKLGRCVSSNFNKKWDEIKVRMMTDIVYEKFEQNSKLKDMLLSTNELKLIEGNWWHDNFWGDCTCQKCLNIKGKNILGHILMEVRSNFQEDV